MDLEKIKAIRARNLAAMEAENRAKEEAKAAEAAAEARAREYVTSGQAAKDMVAMVDLVTSPRLGGRPLGSRQVARLKEIRLRNQIIATVAALQKK